MRRQLLLAALLATCLTAHSREIHVRVSAVQETPCTPSWTATLDKDLANTLLSGPGGAGNVQITLKEYDTLGFTTALKGGAELESLKLRVESEAGPLTIPLVTSSMNPTLRTVDLNNTLYSQAIDALVDGAAAFAKATTVEGEILVGAFSSDCQPDVPQQEVAWTPQETLPSCDLPGFSQLYVIPAGCDGFNDRLPVACGIELEQILLASAYDADGNPVQGARKAVCLPEGCSDPCGPQPLVSELPAAGGLPTTASPLCSEPGFEVFYPVPDECDDLPGRVEQDCNLNLYEVLVASYKSMWLSMGGICLPPGCDPCRVKETQSVEEQLADAAPNCRGTYLFTQAYEIPQGCGDFTEALQRQCGLDAEAIAAASGMQYFPAFAGFGPGKTVCLPEYCQPCQPAIVAS